MGISNSMNIPDNIKVGFQERKDTYTGKLAYVVYTDTKGKLRKETSWEGWRDQKIEAQTFTNEPMSGFVLNKGVGGARQSYGWNARNEYIRIFDPRGFEFEISVANLLFILQECTSTKGKGLEGEFVYAWDRADLVLLPVESQTYKECVDFTDNQTKKVTKEDMVEGCSYLMKDMTNVMYLGRHDWFEPDYDWGNSEKTYYTKELGKKHIFLNLDSTSGMRYIIQTGFTKLAQRTSDVALDNFAEEYDAFVDSVYNSPLTQVIMKEQDISKEDIDEFYYKTLLVKEGSEYFTAYVEKVRRDYNDYKEGSFNVTLSKKPFEPKFVKGKVAVPNADRYYHYGHRDREEVKNYSQKELLKKTFYTVSLSTGKGATYDIVNY